jgi:membrane protein required for colicin V production
MAWPDIAIVLILGVSALVSLIRGFVREVLSLAAWVAAFWVTLAFGDDLALALGDALGSPAARMLLAHVGLFIAVLLAGGLVNFIIMRLLAKSGLAGTDRLLGMFFGLARGIAIVTVLVVCAGLIPLHTRLPRTDWWQASALLPPFETLAQWLVGLLPEQTRANFQY